MKQLISLIMLVLATSSWAALPKSPVSYVSNGESLYVAVHTIEKSIGTPIVLQGVDSDKIISGKFAGDTAQAFLDDFAIKNRLVWEYIAGQVVIAPEGTTLAAPPKGRPAPSNFSKIVHDPKDDNKYGLMIFQVQNAQVEDRRLPSAAGQVKIVPGVATLFRQFIGVSGAPQNGSPSGINGINPAAPNGPGQNQPIAPPPPPNNSMQSLMGLFVKGAVGTEPDVGNTHTRGVYSDVRLNAILVRDKVSLFESYKGIVALLDRPADMVQLEAFIVDVQKDQVLNLGINLGLGGDIATNLILKPFSGRKLLSNLNAMQTEGLAQTLSVPSIVSLNNEQALFSSRQNFYISVAGSYNATVNQITAETQLLVTPQIANESPDIPFDERRVKLLVNVQDAQANATSGTASTNLGIVSSTSTTLPSTTENQITTQAVVRSGDTLVIGGQVVRKKLESTSGLPGASKLGWFGALFAQKGDEFHDYVRLYVVRPKILGEDSASANSITAGSPARKLANEQVQ